MPSRTVLLIATLTVILVVSFVTILPTLGSDRGKTYKPGVLAENDRAVRQAQLVFQRYKDGEMDLSAGPCISNDLLPGWVADVVHNPRQPIDDQIEHQCQAYIEGRAQHYVELDMEGSVVRIK